MMRMLKLFSIRLIQWIWCVILFILTTGTTLVAISGQWDGVLIGVGGIITVVLHLAWMEHEIEKLKHPEKTDLIGKDD